MVRARRTTGANRGRTGKIAVSPEEEPNWEEIFWRVNRYWGGVDSRFNYENFGNQPTWLILQALHHGAKIFSEELHLQELGIATLTACFVNANKDSKSEAAKPQDFFYFDNKEDNISISSTVADTFFTLIQTNQLESWMVAAAPIELLRKSATGRLIDSPLFEVGEDYLFINPRNTESGYFAEFAIINEGIEKAGNYKVEKTLTPYWLTNGKFLYL